MRTVTTIVTLLLSAAAGAQPASLGAASLRTEGLNFADDITRIFVGDFERVGFARDGIEFSLLLGSYMNTFSRTCAAELPPNKVEIMAQECARESWTVNAYGVEQAGSRHCTSYRTVGTGRYAHPEVYDLHRALDARTAQAMVGDVFSAMQRPGGAMGNTRRIADVAIYARDDMPRLLHANGCSHPAVQRLQANMVRFGHRSEPIVLPGAAAALDQAASLPGGPAREQNLKRLLEDLITEQSQAWMVNRFQPGSVRPGSVRRDAQGRLSEASASYSFLAMGQARAGRVRLTFADGVPQCLYYADAPDACRLPSPRILSAYRKHEYADPGAGPAGAAAAPATPGAQPLPRADAAGPASGAGAVTSPAEAQARQDAAAKERWCAGLRFQIDRMRESLATAPPQRAQQAEPQIAKVEAMYAQQCGR